MSAPRSLAQRSVSGVMWTYAGTLLRLCAQIGFTAVLARVLGPTPFGIVGMAVAVLEQQVSSLSRAWAPR